MKIQTLNEENGSSMETVKQDLVNDKIPTILDGKFKNIKWKSFLNTGIAVAIMIPIYFGRAMQYHFEVHEE